MHARAHLRALTCLFAGERLSSDPTQGRGSMLSAPPPIRSVEVGSLEQVDLSIYLSIHRSICLSVPPHQSQAADLLYTYTHKHTQTHIHTHTHTHTHTRPPTHITNPRQHKCTSAPSFSIIIIIIIIISSSSCMSRSRRQKKNLKSPKVVTSYTERTGGADS
jgi:hypothetical protein